MQKAREHLLRITRRCYSSRSSLSVQMDLDSSPPSDRYSFSPALKWNPEVEEYFTKAYGADHFARISQSLTRPSCYSCIRVNTLKSTSDSVTRKLTTLLDDKGLSSSFVCMNVSEQSTATEIDREMSEETPRNADTLTRTSESPSICKCQFPGLDHVLFVKGSGPHTIQYGEQHGKPGKEVIVSRKCAEAVLRGAQVYVPGVLACSSHVEKGDTVAVSVAVEQPGLDGGWAVGITRGSVLQGSQSDAHYHERKGLYIGKGTAMMSRAGIFRASEGVAVEMTDRVYNLPSFYDVLQGEIFLQNLPSIVTAHVLDPQQGERVLDMCAAPGGKTTAIAILMKDKGELVALDRSHNKVMDIQKLAAEMDLSCINACRLDALKSVHRSNELIDANMENHQSSGIVEKHPDSPGLVSDITTHDTRKSGTDVTLVLEAINGKEDNKRYLSKANLRKDARRMRNGPGRSHSMGGRVEKSKGYMPNSFDRVLLDAPCSALGLRPRLFAGEETMVSLRNHARYQKKMFEQAVQLVRPGGVIVYSTCTINPGENEALVRYALDRYKFLSLASQHPRIGGAGLVGRCELFGGEYVEEWLTQGEAELVQRFDPSSPLDTIGFFIAKFNVGEKDN